MVTLYPIPIGHVILCMHIANFIAKPNYAHDTTTHVGGGVGGWVGFNSVMYNQYPKRAGTQHPKHTSHDVQRSAR